MFSQIATQLCRLFSFLDFYLRSVHPFKVFCPNPH